MIECIFGVNQFIVLCVLSFMWWDVDAASQTSRSAQLKASNQAIRLLLP